MKKSLKDPGIGKNFEKGTSRVINKDGSFNIKRINFGYHFRNTYQWLIRINWPVFLSMVTLFIIGSNLIFAGIYFLVEPGELEGLSRGDELSKFFQCLYFSFQSFTTVGYGAISPVGHVTGIISSFESVFGLISFAFITGMLYGRFSRPNASFQYSKNALISPYQKGWSLQFRFVNGRSSQIIELEANVMISYTKEVKGKLQRMFYNLELETKKILFLPLNWTLVHKIDDDSPLFDLDQDTLENGSAEIMILIKGFDDTFSQIVHSRFSYTWEEIVWGGKFVKPYFNDDEGITHLDADLIDKFENIEFTKF
ncbi:MAG: ion channel [Reichenbachiella sp.]|uniref:ion channel n=1 Tax=Reichenbachiella sp. TaxID=2184521 RepID=UPI003263C556